LRKNVGRIGKSHPVGLRFCASAREDFELVSEEISLSCEHSNLEPSDRRRGDLDEIWTRFFGDCCESFCSQSRGEWRKISTAALLCSSALVTAPSLASPVPVAVQTLLASDFVAAAVTLAGALGILQFFDELAKRDVLEKVNAFGIALTLPCLVLVLVLVLVPFIVILSSWSANKHDQVRVLLLRRSIGSKM